MYPNLYYAIKDLFGLDLPGFKMVQSFGFFVAIAFLSCAYYFAKELKRNEIQGKLKAGTREVMRGGKASFGELLISGAFGFIVFYKLIYVILNFSVFIEDTQHYLLSADGNIIGGILGGAAFAFFKYYEKEAERKKYQLDEPKKFTEIYHVHEHVGNMTVIAAVGGLIGAKLFDILESFGSFMKDPWGTIFSFSGLTMYGGLIVGSASVIVYARRNGLTITHVIDACAPGLFLAYGVGRIGCQVAGDGDWGIVNTTPAPSWLPQWMWGYRYPHNVINEENLIPGCDGKFCSQLDFPHYPTPFYEAILGILFFIVLWKLRKRITTPGVLFSVYLILNGFERFFIELIRVNNKYTVLGISFTQAEMIAIILFLLGVFGIYYFKKLEMKNQITANGS